jgi:putative phosphoesterase
MTKILIISDTHGYMGKDIKKFAKGVDEVWHAGDWGNIETSDSLVKVNPNIKGVFGNIDGEIVRKVYKKNLWFKTEGVSIFMTHIGGYPGKYAKGIKELLKKSKPDIFICGHSHICKIVKDKELNILHINPGAIGNKGFHQKRTMVQLEIQDKQIFNVQVIEYDKNYEIA